MAPLGEQTITIDHISEQEDVQTVSKSCNASHDFKMKDAGRGTAPSSFKP